MADFKTIPNGTEVTWHYRGAIGHGTIAGVHKLGTTEANTEYSIHEHDHHVSSSGSKEKSTVQHYGSALTRVSKSTLNKSAAEQRIVLGVAYQAGPDPRIKRGADGSRDYFTADELEKAAATFLRDGGRQIGIEHMDGTIGHAEVCESYTWPSDDPFIYNGEVVANKGDWLIKAVLDQVSWDLVKQGKLTGWSPQGSATRKRKK